MKGRGRGWGIGPAEAPTSPHPHQVRASACHGTAPRKTPATRSLPHGGGGPVFILEAKLAEPGGPSRQQIPSSSRFSLGRMALVLGAVLLAASAAVPPALPAPRDLARSVLETHGQELRLLKLLGVTRTIFDWGTHFSINFTARQPACPKNLPDRRGAGCQAWPGRVQRCTAQVSVFAFLPDVPLSMVECGQEPQPGSSTQSHSPSAPRAFGTNPGHPSSSSSSSRPPQRPRTPTGASLQGTSRRPLSPTELE
ncbi:uncharacterized protein [Haliaeetus albicilla]|uniref:uncharacterized protein isoform X2 n=1 Tax=Haliaeetus albicilla TaxID=8969 RepID=UPI0037E85EA9